jgi:hypothetical protein
MISEKLNTKSRINRRLSITVSALVQVKKYKTIREPDHTRPDATDDSARSGAGPTTDL